MSNIKKIYKQIAIIGGGPAGMAAALEAKRQGADDILIIERDHELGGILNQCIHAGFGLHHFGEELTGPEYACRFIREIKTAGIEYMTGSMALSLSEDRIITFVSTEYGYCELSAGAVILAMGCRERTRGAINIPGTRPAGIMTAGTAQRFINMEGCMPGKTAVILGSGDIGLIMARRLTLEGAKVAAVCEIMPYSNGLSRNIAQCLDDFGIPLKLSHTVINISGTEQVESVTIAKVDEKLNPIMDSAEVIPCDTLLLSVGLIPENELSAGAGIQLDPITGGAFVNESMMTTQEGIFACGNVLHVHDVVDFVTEEAFRAGRYAAEYVKSGTIYINSSNPCEIKAGKGVRYILPHKINTERVVIGDKLFFRTDNIYRNCKIIMKTDDNRVIKEIKKQKTAPSEMEWIDFDEKTIIQLKGHAALTVEIAEG